MVEQTGARATSPSGSIYDLGYRHYDGPRLGRNYAVLSLFSYSYGSIWGMGRSWQAKLFPIGLAVIAAVPGIAQIAVAALAPADVSIARPEEYFGIISIIVALFCAVAAPELIGRDERRHTLPLYFARALSRFDYVFTKLAALILSLFLVLVLPQFLLQAGNAVAADDLTEYVKDNADLLLPIIATSLIIAVFMASLALVIAMQTSRRAFSTGAVIAAFVISSALGGIFIETLGGDARQYSLLISPLGLLEGMVHWVFDARPEFNSPLQKAGLDGAYYFLATVAYTVVAVALIYRRTSRMNV